MKSATGALLGSALVLVATLLAGCHEANVPREDAKGQKTHGQETQGQETQGQETSARPPCVPPYFEWPLEEAGLHVACPPGHPPRFPDPDTATAGARITFAHADEVSGAQQTSRFYAVDTGHLPLQATFVNTGPESLFLTPDQGCVRIRAWLDIDGAPLELTDHTDRWTCPDDRVRRSVPPVHEHRPVITEHFTIGPDHLARLQPGRSYAMYAAFDAENTTWNTTGSADVTVVDAQTLPRITIDIHETDPLNLSATFHNTSNITLGYTTHNTCDRWYARVLQGGEPIGGGPLPPGSFLCGQAITRQTIEPGETRTLPYVHDDPLPPGDYEVFVTVGSAPTWDVSGHARFTVR